MKYRIYIVFMSIVLAIVACKEAPENEIKPDVEKAAVEKPIHVQFAVYYLPKPTVNPIPVLQKIVQNTFTDLTVVERVPDKVTKPIVLVRLEAEVQKRYAAPSIKSLKYFAQGIESTEAEALQASDQALILDFVFPNDTVLSSIKTANKVAFTIAKVTEGILWDEQSRQIFSVDAWQQKRINLWVETYPDLSNHTTIHAYQSGEYVRAITLGMAKFGLPDVTVENFSWSSNKGVGNLINLLSQALLEGQQFIVPGDFDLNLHQIKNRKIREEQVASLLSQATGIAKLALVKGRREEGDPDNNLLEITPSRHPGKDRHAQLDALLTALFGAEDSITYIKHTDELEAASQKVKAQLPALAETFNKGLPPGEFLQFKAPFPTPKGGSEWMWVEVTRWQGGDITGLLKNEPFNIPELHAGQIVTVKQADVFDYIRQYADGTREGNETGVIIQKMQKK